MIIKKYGNIPATYAPDVGEVVLARRSGVDKAVRAVVLNVRRIRSGALQVKVEWLEDDPDAGAAGIPIVAGTIGWVTTTHPAPLIFQISKDRAAGR